jgi:tRNA (cytidine/uridine-2'-O-)-methyltransferase
MRQCDRTPPAACAALFASNLPRAERFLARFESHVHSGWSPARLRRPLQAHVGALTAHLMPLALTLALFEPDIPQNTGTMLRMCACMGIAAALIEPAAFSVSDPRFRRAAMDYLDHVRLTQHASWSAFLSWRREHSARLILLTTRATATYTDFAYAQGDILLVGRESAGVPQDVHDAADARVLVPMQPGLRSLNVAIAAAIVAGEALRQIRSARPDVVN